MMEMEEGVGMMEMEMEMRMMSVGLVFVGELCEDRGSRGGRLFFGGGCVGVLGVGEERDGRRRGLRERVFWDGDVDGDGHSWCCGCFWMTFVGFSN